MKNKLAGDENRKNTVYLDQFMQAQFQISLWLHEENGPGPAMFSRRPGPFSFFVAAFMAVPLQLINHRFRNQADFSFDQLPQPRF